MWKKVCLKSWKKRFFMSIEKILMIKLVRFFLIVLWIEGRSWG